MTSTRKKQVPGHEHLVVPGARHQIGQDRGGLGLTHVGEDPERTVEHISQCNRAEHRRVGQHQKRGNHAQTPGKHPPPGTSGAANITVHRQHDAVPRVSPDRRFGDHQRQGYQQQASDVQQDEQATAVLPRQVGKLPQIGKAHRCTNGGPEEGRLAGPGPDRGFIGCRHSSFPKS